MMQIKQLFTLTAFFLFTTSLFSGFDENTLVLTTQGYKSISQLTPKTSVISYDNQKVTPCTITYTHSTTVEDSINITLEDSSLTVTKDQRFYLPKKDLWIKAENLKRNDIILCSDNDYTRVEDIKTTTGPIKIYEISVRENHNFLVSQKNVLVHNAIPIAVGLSWAIGEKTLEFIGGTIAVAGISLLAKKSKNRSRPTIEIKPCATSVGGFPDPDDDPRNRDRKELNKLIENTAKKLGFKRAKQYPFNSHGEKVFKKGSRYITFDRDGHSGGFWKEMDLKGERMATLDINLNIIGG